MNRCVCAIAMIGILAACGAPSPAVPPAGRSGTALDEAMRLDAIVGELRDAGKFHDAIAPAERSLALREAALGRDGLAVAASLHSLGALHRVRAAYTLAEPLLRRALEIRERALGPDHPDVAQSLEELGWLHLDRAEYDQAEPLLVRALALRERVGGALDPGLARSLHGVAELHRARGDLGKAEQLLVRALDLREKALAPMHPEVAVSLNSLADIYRTQGALDKAEPLYRRALDLREKVRGAMHPDVASSLVGIAGLYTDQGEYGKAEPLYIRAIAIAEQAFGVMHPEVARIRNSLGVVYRLQGAYDTAREQHLRARDIAEKALGAWHPDVAQTLSDLGNVYLAQGAYDKADELYTRALAIREKAFGPMHIQVARTMNNLGLIAQRHGTYGKAEPLFVRARDIAENALGPMHPHLATILNNLATLYWDLGAYGKAEPLLVRAIDILEKALGPMHADLGPTLQNLAGLHHAQGAYAKAEPLYIRALAINEKAFGPMHPEVATVLSNLAWMFRDQRKYSRAEPLLLRALDINEKALGPMHPAGAMTLENLAGLYRDQRAYAKAEPLLIRALDIREKALGPMHPDVAMALYNLARLYWVQGAFDRALPLLSRAAEIQEGQLRVELPRLSEPRKRAFMTFTQEDTDSLISLHVHAMPSDERALELALTTILRRKGRTLDSMVDDEATLRAHLTAPLRNQLDELDQRRAELVAGLYTPHDSTDHASVAAIRSRIDDLEAALSAASAEFRAQSEPITVAAIRATVPVGAALVELARYRRHDPRQVQASREERYVAYVVTARGPVQWVALGPVAPIDRQVDIVLAANADKVSERRTSAALRRLDAMVLAPIRGRLAGVSHLILAPDGKLNLVPFEALIDPQQRYAVARYLVSYVTTGRDLLRFAAPSRPRSPGVIVAGPEYGPFPSGPRPIKFAPLAGALGEVADLQRYFPEPPLTGDKATKSALKGLVGPAILHIATHGFYAQDRGPESGRASARPSREMFTDRNSAVLPPPRPDDPMEGLDRAGLALAGANRGPDGIVTAREIAGFDWWGTQLVVLSACETGVGAVPSGEGVYGLRRALVLAGAASQVVSLWSVDDASTRTLMRDYYAELAQGTGRAEALRAAKLRLLRDPRYANPYFWAAFIPTGDWHPLDTSTMAQRGDHPGP